MAESTLTQIKTCYQELQTFNTHIQHTHRHHHAREHHHARQAQSSDTTLNSNPKASVILRTFASDKLCFPFSNSLIVLLLIPAISANSTRLIPFDFLAALIAVQISSCVIIYFLAKEQPFIVLKSAISRQAKASELSLVLWLNEIVRNL